MDSMAAMMDLGVYFLYPRPKQPSTKGVFLLPMEVLEGKAPGRRVDALVDLQLVKRWLYSCEQWHTETGCCAKHEPLNSTPLLRVIDVRKGCLAYISPSSRYFALSYVWGQVKTLTMTEGNRAALELDGSLSTRSSECPKTIRDAMDLVRRLGERYLWVDALCITQDSDGEKTVLLRQMDKIYGNAYLTVVAASGDNADCGLPGISDDCPRAVTQTVVSYGENRRFAISQPPFANQLSQNHNDGPEDKQCTWNRRAWTLQERLLSRRKLVFLQDSVHFNCHSMTWSEDVAAETQETKRHFQMYDFEGVTDEERWFSGVNRRLTRPRKRDEYTLRGLDMRFPSFLDYCNLVSNHLQRGLTKEEDILNAFGGILGSLSHAFGTFHHGLPDMFFTMSLIWQPMDFCRRRIRGQQGASRNAGGGSLFPSWSWAGWVCDIDVQHWRAACDYVVYDHIPRSYRVTPAVIFTPCRPGERITDSQAQICDNGLRYRHFADQPADAWKEPLPYGWHHLPMKPHFFYGRTQYTEFNIRDDDDKLQFLYPVPLASSETTSGAAYNHERSQLPMLHFSAETAVFAVSSKYHDYGSRKNAASVLDADGNWCGTVILHQRLSNDDDVCETEVWEFAKIADGEVYVACTEEDVFPEAALVRSWARRSGQSWYRFSVVVMIRWRSGVGERMAIGRIRAEAWEAVHPVAKDVWLG